MIRVSPDTINDGTSDVSGLQRHATMNIIFVNYHHFKSNSAIHIFNLANELTTLRHSCVVAVPNSIETVFTLGAPRFQCLTYEQVLAGELRFPDGRGPSLIHGWTPREAVRDVVERLAARYGCPYFVHMEDNEEYLTESQLGINWSDLARLDVHHLDRIVESGQSHPVRYPMLLGRAAGVTAIIDRLLEFKPPDIPGTVIWPAYEHDLFRAQPADPRLREQLKIPGGHFVVVYPGNAHAANAREMRSLYLAIGAVNRCGLPVTLVRLGQGYIDFLGPDLAHLRAHTIDVGQVPHLEVPRYLALADVLIQPGRADRFNDYRFPSKLPEFFGMGRPIILPQSNIGHQVRDREDALLLHDGSALEIAQNLEMLLRDPEMRQRLGDGARAFAEENFDWRKSAKKLETFYLAHSNHRGRTIGSAALEQVATRYRSFAPATLSYATVEDYSDSQQHLPQLAGLQKDMKDVQRPWALKAILGRVPRGSRLLEVGGGDPYVASILATLGYEVWVIDPYEGLGNGPREFDAIKVQAPQVRFIRGWFPDALSTIEDSRFDCIYSISVLEHVPGDLIEGVASAASRHLRDNGWNIHAVDHVTLGWGAEDHRRRLGLIAQSFGFSEAELDKLLMEMEGDPDAYFLSADAHNLWRGARAYRDFPMRRCVSIQFCGQAMRSPPL